MLRQLANFDFHEPFAFYVARQVEKSTKESLACIVTKDLYQRLANIIIQNIR